MSLSQEIQDLPYNFSVVLIQWQISFHFQSLSDDLELVTFLSLVVGFSLFLIVGKKFSQLHLIII